MQAGILARPRVLPLADRGTGVSLVHFHVLRTGLD